MFKVEYECDDYDLQGRFIRPMLRVHPKTPWQRVAALFGLRRGVVPIETRNGLADVEVIRKQVPLPEMADELCTVARDINADTNDVRLGARATEREVKAMSFSRVHLFAAASRTVIYACLRNGGGECPIACSGR